MEFQQRRDPCKDSHDLDVRKLGAKRPRAALRQLAIEFSRDCPAAGVRRSLVSDNRELSWTVVSEGRCRT
jgi:hypothetical protein